MKKIYAFVLCGIMVLGLTTGCVSSSNGAEKAVKDFVGCQYEVDLQCVVTSIDYSGAMAYKKAKSSLDNFWEEYKVLEDKNTNAIVMKNANKNYDLAKNLYNQYEAKVTKTEAEKIGKDIYKVKTTVSLKNKDRSWDSTTNYIMINVDGKYKIIDMTADDSPVYVISSTIEKMVKGLKYGDGTSLSY